MNTMQKGILQVAFGSIAENTLWHLKCERVNNGSIYLNTKCLQVLFDYLFRITLTSNY